ncbi:MAG TPA: ABC transporter ATP-binding protein [Kiloniellales bacterium]|nr:ABC transporter ATP-binding protein [Kiloniellales bacterium]
MTDRSDRRDLPDLDVRNVTKRFGDFVAVDGVSFSVPGGSFFSILGPSGCGKTTLMRMIAGFAEPDEGEIVIRGKPMNGVPPNRRPASMVFQHLALFPMMSVADNVGYGLRRRGVAKAEITRRVGAMLERVGLPGAENKRIEELSGGQKQRVAIARCLVLDPDLLLLDEPLGALDLKLREHMKIELKQLQAEVGTTFLYITHDQSEALVMSDHVAVMNHGRFEQIGTGQELYYDPKTRFVAGFVGNSNRWTGRVEGIEDGIARVTTEAGLDFRVTTIDRVEQGARVEVFVRPEAIAVSRDLEGISDMTNRLEGRIESLLFDGANSTALVADRRTSATVTVALPQVGILADLQAGQEIHLGWDKTQARCFQAPSRAAAGEGEEQ